MIPLNVQKQNKISRQWTISTIKFNHFFVVKIRIKCFIINELVLKKLPFLGLFKSRNLFFFYKYFDLCHGRNLLFYEFTIRFNFYCITNHWRWEF
jgi:hypothetical protein